MCNHTYVHCTDVFLWLCVIIPMCHHTYMSMYGCVPVPTCHHANVSPYLCVNVECTDMSPYLCVIIVIPRCHHTCVNVQMCPHIYVSLYRCVPIPMCHHSDMSPYLCGPTPTTYTDVSPYRSVSALMCPCTNAILRERDTDREGEKKISKLRSVCCVKYANLKSYRTNMCGTYTMSPYGCVPDKGWFIPTPMCSCSDVYREYLCAPIPRCSCTDVSLYTSVQECTGMGTHWSFCHGHDTCHMGTGYRSDAN